MARKLFVAATGKDCGKTTVCLSLLHCAAQKYRRVGFIKPVGPKLISYQGQVMDKDAALMCEVFQLHDQLPWLSPVAVHGHTTRDVLDGTLDPLLLHQQILEACRQLEQQCDFIVIEGSGHAGVGSVLGCGNATVARLLQAPVMMVAEAGIGRAVDLLHMNLALFDQAEVPVHMILINKIVAEKREENLGYLQKAFSGKPLQVEGGFNFSPVLANPTLSRISRILDVPLQGNVEERQRIIHHVQLGAASAQRVADLLQEATLLLVNSSRDELMVMLASLYHLPEYRHKIAGLVIPGYAPVSPITQKIVDDSGIPYMRTTLSNSEAFARVTGDVAKISADDREKIDLIRRLAETELPFDAIDALIR
ncbi:MAG: AAA family ATPase [Desulfuromonadaceae bacterium]|nr:AAA family ATPase [Desulfuromonadaceae bacterium]